MTKDCCATCLVDYLPEIGKPYCQNPNCPNCHSKTESHKALDKMENALDKLERYSKTESMEERFDKEFITSHPGDSGFNGSDPQEPVYELNIDFDETYQEVKRLKFFIASEIKAAEVMGMEKMLEEIIENLPTDIEVADGPSYFMERYKQQLRQKLIGK